MKERRLEQDSGKAEIPGRRRPLEEVMLEQRLALREERAGRAESHKVWEGTFQAERRRTEACGGKAV